MQSLPAVEVLDKPVETIKAVMNTDDDFDYDFYGSYEAYKAAEARFAERIKEANEAYKNGTLKAYTREEYEPMRREFWRKLKEKHAHAR